MPTRLRWVVPAVDVVGGAGFLLLHAKLAGD